MRELLKQKSKDFACFCESKLLEPRPSLWPSLLWTVGGLLLFLVAAMSLYNDWLASLFGWQPPAACRSMPLWIDFAGSSERFSDLATNESCRLSGRLRPDRWVAIATLTTIVPLVVAARVIHVSWSQAFRLERPGAFSADRIGSTVKRMALAGAVLALAQLLLALVVLDSNRLAITTRWWDIAAPVLATLGWIKWVCIVATIAAVFMMAIALIENRDFAPVTPHERSVTVAQSAERWTSRGAQESLDAANAVTHELEIAANAKDHTKSNEAMSRALEQAQVAHSCALEATRFAPMVPAENAHLARRMAEVATSHADQARLDVGATLDRPLHDPVIGVCCSGGGIRSAAFSIGALGQLEDQLPYRRDEESLLHSATYLSTVSGGGYAGLAWRIAQETHDDPPKIGNPFDSPDQADSALFDDNDALSGCDSFFDYMRLRSRFLETGRGGTVTSVAMLVAYATIHIGIIGLALWLVSYPLGQLIGSWPIDDGQPISLRERRLIGPVVVLGVLFLVGLAGRSLTWNSKARRRWNIALGAIAGTTVLGGAVLLALPIAAKLEIGWSAWVGAAGFVGTGIALTVVQFLASTFKARLLRAGGVLLTALAAVVAVNWVRLGSEGKAPLGFKISSWWVYACVAGVYVLLYLLLDPTRWSLHRIYRDRLRAAFASTDRAKDIDTRLQAEDDAFGTRPTKRSGEPLLSEYRDHHGPQPIVCCAAARSEGGDTGLPAMSMVFTPEKVTVYDRAVKEPANSSLTSELEISCPTEDYIELVRERHWKPLSDDRWEQLKANERLASWVSNLGYFSGLPALIARWLVVARKKREHPALGQLSSLMAISGAAVAPALGRHDLGSTKSLFAILNARLGVWMPNPDYRVSASTGVWGKKRFKSPRMNYLFKEIFGWFDKTEPYLYVTDGGHWENLGLVELLRRRCELIICIDSSDDPPGSFNTLRTAIELAEVELFDPTEKLSPKVELSDELLEPMSPPDRGHADKGHAIFSVVYPDGSTAKLVYVSNIVHQDSHRKIRAFSNNDEQFPRYTTVDQFLTDAQFLNLARLGWQNTRLAMAELDPDQFAPNRDVPEARRGSHPQRNDDRSTSYVT